MLFRSDQEIHLLIEKVYQRAKDIIAENRIKIEQIANALLTNEVIFREDVEQILGRRPFEPEEIKEEEKFIPQVVEAIQNEDNSENIPLNN